MGDSEQQLIDQLVWMHLHVSSIDTLMPVHTGRLPGLIRTLGTLLNDEEALMADASLGEKGR